MSVLLKRIRSLAGEVAVTKLVSKQAVHAILGMWHDQTLSC
jgi:hypothetical protein